MLMKYKWFTYLTYAGNINSRSLCCPILRVLTL